MFSRTNFQNIFSLIKCLNFYKLYNFLLIYLNYLLSVTTKKHFNLGNPWSISIEPTTNCNLSCIECPSGQNNLKRKTGSMNIDIFTKIIEQVNKYAFYLTLYFQGEPFLNQKFFQMVSIARKKKLYVSTSTNGHFLTKRNAEDTVLSGLNRIIISLDGINQKTYELYRKGGDFDKVIEGIKNLVAAKKELKKENPFIILQFIVFSTNEGQIEEIKKIGKELGVNQIQIKTAQINDIENSTSLLPDEIRYSRYKMNKENKFVLKRKLLNKCYKIWHSLVITWDGNVIPCCYDKHADYIMGNISSEKMINIWKSKKFSDFKKEVLKNRKKIPICLNCNE